MGADYSRSPCESNGVETLAGYNAPFFKGRLREIGCARTNELRQLAAFGFCNVERCLSFYVFR
jgi:hypothetical protein